MEGRFCLIGNSHSSQFDNPIFVVYIMRIVN